MCFSFIRTYFIVASRIVRPSQIYRVAVSILTSPISHLSVRASILRNGVDIGSATQECKPGIPETLLIKVSCILFFFKEIYLILILRDRFPARQFRDNTGFVLKETRIELLEELLSSTRRSLRFHNDPWPSLSRQRSQSIIKAKLVSSILK